MEAQQAWHAVKVTAVLWWGALLVRCTHQLQQRLTLLLPEEHGSCTDRHGSNQRFLR